MVRLAWLGTLVDTRHDDRDVVEGQGAIDIVHDQDLAISEARLGVDVGLSRRFGASVVVPVRIVATSIRYLDGAGNEIQLEQPDVHHRDETVTGIGDPMLLGAVGGELAGMRWTARAGLTIPLGRTEDDPFALGDMGLAHQHIQIGSGTVNPVVAGELSRSWGPWRLGGFAFTQQVLYENGKGYQAGDRYAGGVSLRRALGSAWSARGGGEVQAETAERWDGIVRDDEGNRGRIDVMIALGAGWSPVAALTVDLAVKIPVVTHVVGGQLDMPAIVELGASWSFGGGGGAKDEHEHEHGDEHEHAHGDAHEGGEVDVADVGSPGEAVDLVPVAGKITIFDFWATWCAPCHELSPKLVDLARAHPDRIAIRKIDVVDWDSAAAARYLDGFNLPHLKVYDATGKLALERSAPPDVLIEALRAVID